MSLNVTMNNTGFNISTGLNLAYVDTNTPIYPATGGKYGYKVLAEVTYKLQHGGSNNTKTVSFTQQVSYTNNSFSYLVMDFRNVFSKIPTPQITSIEEIRIAGVPAYYDSIHNMPYILGVSEWYQRGLLSDTQGMESFRGVANVLDVKFYEFYSDTENGIPQKQGSAYNKKIFLFWGRGTEEQGFAIDFTDYKLTSPTKKLLASNYNEINSEYFINIGVNEVHTLAFLNLCLINQAAQPESVNITYYPQANAQGTSIGFLNALNDTTIGGKYDSTLDDESFYLFFPAGIPNLNNTVIDGTKITGVIPSSATGGITAIKSYKIQVKSGGSNKSISYIFNIVTYCKNYDQSRIAYVNEWGAWEYITLNKERTDELSVTKQYLTKPVINQQVGLSQFTSDAKNIAYPPNVAKQGVMATSVEARITTTMWTDNLEEDWQVNQIRDLMMSPQIHLIDGEKAVALILENSKLQLKREKNRGIKQYELKFTFANPKYRTTS
tara:strand:+ start:466 stop:1947 length:1482 start_codon:yes stop_codon:yes gene_type:complete